jgi:hypothetical protein
VLKAAPAAVAAGHAAFYALVLARDRPGVSSHAVLLAPTWRGPLPTAMGVHPRAYAWVRGLVVSPVIGEALYRLNTLGSVICLDVSPPRLQRGRPDHSGVRYEKAGRGAPAGSTLRVSGVCHAVLIRY